MPFVRAGGLTVHYDDLGPRDAQPVVFANSLGTNLHIWETQATAFSHDYRVVRYDMRGHGMTSLAPAGEDYAIARLADDLGALLDALGITRAHVVGLSIGGMVAQRFAAVHPDRVDKLVLCATGSRIGSPEVWNPRIATIRESGIGAIVEATLGRWFTPATREQRPALVSGFGAMLARTPVEGYVGCCEAIRDADLREDDTRITAPTLVVSGQEDPVTPPSSGETIREAVPGARLSIIDGAAHMLCAEQPEALNALLSEFFATPAPAKGGAA